jgi:hypothetical protein
VLLTGNDGHVAKRVQINLLICKRSYDVPEGKLLFLPNCRTLERVNLRHLAQATGQRTCSLWKVRTRSSGVRKVAVDGESTITTVTPLHNQGI